MSLGVNLLAALVKRVAKTLDDCFDIEIFEMHHNKKIDAPSGTALMFGRAAAEGRGIDLAQHSARGRDGETGARRAGDIGFASLRGGTVVGEHSVIFAGPAERVELVHRAEDRMIFARGALHAALWARGPEARPLFDGRRAGAEGLLERRRRCARRSCIGIVRGWRGHGRRSKAPIPGSPISFAPASSGWRCFRRSSARMPQPAR